MRFTSALISLLGLVAAAPSKRAGRGPFLETLGNNTWIIGNDLWNVTQGPTYGTQLYYKGHDCVGEAVGHYVSYSLFPYLHVEGFCH